MLRNGSEDYIGDYMIRKQLSEIGVTFDGEGLSNIQVEYLALINSCIKEHENRQKKKVEQTQRRGHGRR